ncbi:MAG: alpha-galactosidase [Opitutaceae bacterium]|nr:alpha-galactosidase [Opitutaceae bacterium]
MAAPDVTVTMKRDADYARLPVFEVRNPGSTTLAVTIASSLEDTGGELRQQATATHTVPANGTATLPACADPAFTVLRDDIALLRSRITLSTAPDAEPVTHSAIVGTPRPVARDGDYFVGINAALPRYTAEEQWRLLRMMREAGITSVRIEPGFRARDPGTGDYATLNPGNVEQSLLACEAYGMNTLFLLSYFPKPFSGSAEKAHLAYDWAYVMAKHYKGRVHDWQFGNETNSGWGAYGAAADMAVHNQAMSFGVLAANPDARPATLGIAEALPYYLRELFRNGLAPYVKAVTGHPYCGVPESGVSKLMANRRVICEFGGDQEIWATEVGFYHGPSTTVNPVTEQLTQSNGYSLETQADQLARLYLLARAQGIERVYWYNLYGKRDRETYWLLDENFNPRPAYETLKLVTAFLRGTTPLGGTGPDEPLQYQLYRKPDGGAASLALWSVRNNTRARLHLPAGLALTVRDTNGKPVRLPEPALTPDGRDATWSLTIGQTPLLIEGLPPTTQPWTQLDLLANSLDSRAFNLPLHRQETRAGETIAIPLVVYNPGKQPVRAHPVVLKNYPGWDVRVPAPFDIAPGQTVTKTIAASIPADSVPGVEYRLRFAVETAGPRRTTPFETRIHLYGQFPYGPLFADDGHAPGYPVRRPDFDEGVLPTRPSKDFAGFGRENLTARRATPDTKVDGNLQEWDPAEFVTLDQGGQWILRDVGAPHREEWFVRAALRWDDTCLYVAWAVLDNDLSHLDLVSRDWRDSDNLRVFLSSEEPEKRQRALTEKDLLLYMAPSQQFGTEPPAVLAAIMGGVSRDGIESRIKTASRVWHGGYVMEAAIPLSAIQVDSPCPGMTLGCNLLADNATQGWRDQTRMTTMKTRLYWTSPEGTLGTLRLVE